MKQKSKRQYDYQYKFVMVDDSAVGKSSLLLRFADNQFNQNYMITIGVDFRFKSITINEQIVKMQIWDTAGQERFRTIVNTYYKNAQAVYLIFDLTNVQSFHSIKSYWINQVESYTDEGTLLVLVGNKSDCERIVAEGEVRAFVEEKGLIYYQTSAKKAVNVHEMFVGIAQQLTERKITNKQTNSHNPAKKLEQRQESVRHSNCQC